MPLHRHHSRSPLPGRAVARPSAHRMPSDPHVPSLSFHPTPTVFSSRCSAGLLHPAADHGVRRVLVARAQHECCARRSRDLPYGASPSKPCPSQHSSGASPRSLPSRRCSWMYIGNRCIRSLDLRALLRVRSRCETLSRCQESVARCFLGLLDLVCVWSDPSLDGARARSVRQAERWGTSRSPRANPGPAATVADGADRLCDAEPASVHLRRGEHPQRGPTGRLSSADRSTLEYAGHPPTHALY